MNSLVKDALKLVIITVVAGLVLGAVYGITKKPIADQEAKAQMEAITLEAASSENPSTSLKSLAFGNTALYASICAFAS